MQNIDAVRLAAFTLRMRHQQVGSRVQGRLAERFAGMAWRMAAGGEPGPAEAEQSPAERCVRRALTAAQGDSAAFWPALSEEVGEWVRASGFGVPKKRGSDLMTCPVFDPSDFDKEMPVHLVGDDNAAVAGEPAACGARPRTGSWTIEIGQHRREARCAICYAGVT